MSTTIYSNLFLDNKYTRWYYKICDASRKRHNNHEYRERHHIIPRSLGGSDNVNNIAVLTAREHFICHALLYRMTEGIQKRNMAYAWNCMRASTKDQKRYFNSRLFEATRINSYYSGTSSPRYKVPHTEEAKKKISESHKGKIVSVETKKKISETLTGRKIRKESCKYCMKKVAINWMPQHVRKYH